MRKVEGVGGCGIGHFTKDGDLLAGPVGEKFFRALLGERWDLKFAAFPSDGGFVDSGSEGDIAVRHLSEEGNFLFRPVVPGFGLAGVAPDAEVQPFFINGEDVHAVDSGYFAIGNLA